MRPLRHVAPPRCETCYAALAPREWAGFTSWNALADDGFFSERGTSGRHKRASTQKRAAIVTRPIKASRGPVKKAPKEECDVTKSHAPRIDGRDGCRRSRRGVQFPEAGDRTRRAVQARPAHGQDRPTRAGRHPDGTGRSDLPEGKKFD